MLKIYNISSSSDNPNCIPIIYFKGQEYCQTSQKYRRLSTKNSPTKLF